MQKCLICLCSFKEECLVFTGVRIRSCMHHARERRRPQQAGELAIALGCLAGEDGCACGDLYRFVAVKTMRKQEELDGADSLSIGRSLQCNTEIDIMRTFPATAGSLEMQCWPRDGNFK